MFRILVRKSTRQLVCSKVAQPLFFRPAFLSTDAKSTDGAVPDDFFDEDVEAEKEFCDISMSLIHERGLEGINSISKNYSWKDLSEFSNYKIVSESSPADEVAGDPDFEKFVQAVRNYKDGGKVASDKQEGMNRLKEQIKTQLTSLSRNEKPMDAAAFQDAVVNGQMQSMAEESDSEYEDNGEKGKVLLKESKRGPFVPHVTPSARVDETAMSAMQNMAGDLSEHLAHIEDTNYFTPHALNYTMPQRPSSEYPFEHLEDFVPNTDPSKFREDEQGQRHCPGRKQRRGKRPDAPLGCHLIDLDTLHPVDIPQLKRFLTQDGEIFSRKQTGLCPRCQRQVARTVKHSRSMGILPHLGALVMADARPARQHKPFHNVVKGGGKNGKAIMSKLVSLN